MPWKMHGIAQKFVCEKEPSKLHVFVKVQCPQVILTTCTFCKMQFVFPIKLKVPDTVINYPTRLVNTISI